MKLIMDRRKVAAGIASLIAMPVGARAALSQLDQIPLELDSIASGYLVDSGGLLVPDWSRPMVRLLYDDGTATSWYRYHLARGIHSRQRGSPGAKAIAIESVAPDGHGMPRFAQVKIG